MAKLHTSLQNTVTHTHMHAHAHTHMIIRIKIPVGTLAHNTQKILMKVILSLSQAGYILHTYIVHACSYLLGTNSTLTFDLIYTLRVILQKSQ